VHTTTIEGFWSIFKRGIVGFPEGQCQVYAAVRRGIQFRHNYRRNADIFVSAIEGA
jgi:hypothetical protein